MKINGLEGMRLNGIWIRLVNYLNRYLCACGLNGEQINYLFYDVRRFNSCQGCKSIKIKPMKGNRNNEIDANGGLKDDGTLFEPYKRRIYAGSRDSRICIENINLVAGSPLKQKKGVKLVTPFIPLIKN